MCNLQMQKAPEPIMAVISSSERSNNLDTHLTTDQLKKHPNKTTQMYFKPLPELEK